MCNMPKSMRMSRPEYDLCTVRNANNTDHKMKNDLESAWIYPRPSGSDASFHCSPHRSTLHASSFSLVPGTSFRQLNSQRKRPGEHVIPSSIAGEPVQRASPRRSGLKLALSVRCTLNSGCLVSLFRLQSNPRCPQLSVAGNRSGHLIT